ncbi:MAG: lysophospholipid acyltransferase family protein [Desulfobacterium sp.]|nr:lysophospholipid acyltransferase family protein [Desulfobacterium sp.]
MENKETPRQFGTGLGIKIFYGFIRAGGQKPAYALLYVVVFYYLLFSPRARESASHYISRRFPDAGGFRVFIHTYRLIVSLGRGLIDSAAVSIKGTSAMNATCPDKEALHGLINHNKGDNKGVILLMSHAGCWQAAMSALDFLPIPLNMVMQIYQDHDNYHLLKHKASNIKVIDSSGYLGGTIDIMKALARGEGVSVMGDRLFEADKNGLDAQFLGAEARFPYSAFRIASATGAPILVLFASKLGGVDYRVELSKVIRVPQGLGRKKAAYQPYLDDYIASLEQYCEKFPYQFFNFYNMWKL